jgi:hypothetical protein
MGKNFEPACGYGFFSGYELELAGADMEQHCPTGFYLLPSLVGTQIIASDEPTPSILHSSDEFSGQRVQNRPLDEPTV